MKDTQHPHMQIKLRGFSAMGFEEYFDTHFGKKVAVCGIGVSNIPLIRILCDRGIEVEARDRKSEDELGETATLIKDMGAKLICGPGYLESIDADIIYRSPGMRHDLIQFERAVQNGAVLTSEMEAFFEVCPCNIIGVTGSDGKSTTSTVIAKMLEKAGYRTWLGGNIGMPLLDKVPDMKSEDYVVLELSSFQLMTMRKSPYIAVVTNVTPNHLDVHKDMDEYVAAKRNIFSFRTTGGKTVLNWDNLTTRNYALSVKGPVYFFSSKESHDQICMTSEKIGMTECDRISTVTLLENVITINTGKNKEPEYIVDISDIKLPGMHNVENYMAAVAAVYGIVSNGDIVNTARTFEGVEHRIEFVGEYSGIRYYNDSIASSPTRTIAGLKAFSQKVILIAGGYDKQLSYQPLAQVIPSHVKALVLMGATKKKIRAAVEKLPECADLLIYEANTLEEAVLSARGMAKEGDIVLFSPASASFDMFANFEERGKAFKNIVKKFSQL